MKMTPTIQTQPHALKRPMPMRDIDDTNYKQDDADDCADGPKPDHRQHCTSDKGGD